MTDGRSDLEFVPISSDIFLREYLVHMHNKGDMHPLVFSSFASCFELNASVVFHTPIDFSVSFFKVLLTFYRARHSQVHVWDIES